MSVVKMPLQYKTIESVDYLGQSSLYQLVVNRTTPLVIKGLVKNWPMTKTADDSKASLDALANMASPQYVFVNSANASSKGRFFYNDEFTDKNFTQSPIPLPDFIDQLKNRVAEPTDKAAPFLYMASTSVDYCFPEFRASHSLPGDLELSLSSPLISAWFGSESVAATHFDVPNNIACNVIGRRKFTLFPPAQVANLYVGPLDFTPAGQPVSLVNINEPDFSQFPRFKNAISEGFQVTLEPGDALYIPSMWWHNVESLNTLNLLINYWWSSAEAYLGQPMDALKLSALTIKNKPKAEKQAWKHLFDQFVFEQLERNSDSSLGPTHTSNHIPEHAQGVLGKPDENVARRIRAELIKSLNK